MMPLEAHQALLRFAQRRGTAALRLLLHAAVPQSFRPELLALIRANFVPEADGHSAAEADVMLAPFCETLGNGYFQLDPEIRRQCLDHLGDLGGNDAAMASLEQRVAALLLAFIERCEARPGLSRDPLLPGWLEVQRWVAAAFLDPDATAMGLADALSASGGALEPVAAVQLGAVTAAVSLPLANYPSLIAYAMGLGALHAGDRSTAQRLLWSVAGQDLHFGSVELPPPEQVLGQRPESEGGDGAETVAVSDADLVQRSGGTEYHDDAVVFISYARSDDESPPFDDTSQGWVTFFWQQLRWELTNAGLHQAKLWLDRYEIEPAEDFTDKIRVALHQARLFVAILSPNYLHREYCVKELRYFLSIHAELDEDALSRVVLIKKSYFETQALPPGLRTRAGFMFFQREQSGAVREFYRRGLQDDEAYFRLLKDVASLIKRRLTEDTDLTASPTDRSGEKVVKTTAEQPSKPTPQEPSVVPNERTIYLAAPPDELRDCWLRLANDLRGSGYTVLPSEGRLADTLPAAEAEIADALARAALSVHLLGESEGGKPDGSEETLARLQLRLAREHAGRPVGLPRVVLWAPKWLPERPERKRDPFEVVRRFGGLLPGEELYAEDVTDLSQWLRARLNPFAPASASSISTLLIAGAVPADDGLVSVLANRLQSDRISVRPVFAGDPLPADPDVVSSAALVPWGKADRSSVDALLDKLAPLGLPITVLSLPGDDETAKIRFFRPGVYSEPLEAVPADRRAARALLARLEITEGVDP
jgi:hypothetical protein